MSDSSRLAEEQLKRIFECSPIPKWVEDYSRVFARLDELHATGVSCWESYFSSNPEEVAHCARLVRIVNANQASVSLFQAEHREDIFRDMPGYFTEKSWGGFKKRLISLAEGQHNFSGEIEMLTLLGERKHFLHYWEAVPDSFRALENVVVSFVDITDSHRTGRFDKWRTHMLDLVMQGASLEDALGALLRFEEDEYPATSCSVMLLDNEAKCLHTVVSSNLPDVFNDAVNGMTVCCKADSCDSVICICGRHIVDDIQRHPNWGNIGPASVRATLRACWSEPIVSPLGQLLGVFSIFHQASKIPAASDIELMEQFARLAGVVIERHLAQKELHCANMVYQAIGEAMLITDPDGLIVAVNPGFTKMTGYSQHEVVGKPSRVFMSERQDQPLFQSVSRSQLLHGGWQGEIWGRHKNGEESLQRMSVNNVFDEHGNVIKHVAMLSAAPGQGRAEPAELQQPGLGSQNILPSRQQFRDQLDREIKRAHREGFNVGLLGIDLDKFKEVNETLGHNIGDMLLQEAARRIASCIRDVDTVARLGGDEFGVILTACPDAARVEQIAIAINKKISEPFQLGDEVVYISASIGITFYPTDGADADSLIKNAEQSMYVAKNDGRNRYSFYTSSLQEAAQARRLMINDLRGALADNQLRVYFQPIVDLKDGRIFKAEALLRWEHPVFGMIAPMEFIPLAEETGLINEIGDWVFRESANCAKRWNNIYAGGVQVSINKSPIQFRNAKGASAWIKYLSEIGLPGNCVVIEITESVLLDSSPHILNQLLKYREAGVQISIDDFGTGYSSLSYLKKFDADYLKIDRSFIMDMVDGNQDMVLSEAIIAMAHKLGITVIAEGVETAEQRSLLTNANCNFGQGFHFSKAVSAEEFEFLLDNKKYNAYAHSLSVH